MRKIKPNSVGNIALALLSLTLLTQSVFGYDDEKITLLDRVSDTYLQENQIDSMVSNFSNSNILNMNSPEARGFETTLKLDASPVITDSEARVNLTLSFLFL